MTKKMFHAKKFAFFSRMSQKKMEEIMLFVLSMKWVTKIVPWL